MGIFRSYQIIADDLTLNEDLFWTFEPEHQEAIQEWTMINFDKSSITVEQLEHLVNYGEDADVEIEQENGKTKVWIYN